MHLDIAVTATSTRQRKQALGLGARRLPGQGPSFRVYSDPAGHPFCLVTLGKQEINRVTDRVTTSPHRIGFHDPDGLDMAPEPLYERARAHPLVAA
jgi:hypothetical protein